MIRTNEGAVQNEHSLNHPLEFYSKAGSLFEGKKSFYNNEESALSLFQKSWIAGRPELNMKLLFWLRDCRGGAGNRSAFRSIVKWLSGTQLFQGQNWIKANLDQIPEYGRWDDLRSLYTTALEADAVKIWTKAIQEENVLAAKWADRKKERLIKHQLKLKVADFRRLLAKIRAIHIPEHKMSQKRWTEIDYKSVPSVAMARYANAFRENDADRFSEYKLSLITKETTIKASVLFPHDCVRTCEHDPEIADAQFDALPDYIGDTKQRIIVLADTSGSMSINVAGSVTASDVSQGLALYCSSRIPEDSPFHKCFIGFESESRFVQWRGKKFSEVVNNQNYFDCAVGSTRIDKALDLILDTGLTFKLTKEQMPTMLVIVSDMQFSSGVTISDSRSWHTHNDDIEKITVIQKAMAKWTIAGYDVPKIIYWNVAGYTGSPATIEDKNIGLVSGFSPARFKAILANESLDPISIMEKDLEKYVIKPPN